MIAVNSSPIINLAKQGQLALLEKCFKKVVMPVSVYDEILKKSESPESIALNKAISEKWILVQKVSVMSKLETKNIAQGEKEAISLAYRHKTMLIIDDDSAKKYASIFGVESHGTLFVIYSACVKKLIDKKKAINLMEGIIAEGFYISSELYTKFISLLDALNSYP